METFKNIMQMKKINFIAILICIGILSACKGSSDKYVITGVVHDHVANGEKVYIYDFNEGDIIDSTKIVSGKFSFDGAAGEARAVRLVVEHHHVNFILEKGNVKINMSDEPYSVKGSPLTDKLNGFLTEYENLIEEVREDFMSIGESVSVVEASAARDKILEDLSVKIDKLVVSYLKQYPDNVLGAMIFCTWVENQIGVTPEKFMEYSGIVGERVLNFGPLKQMSVYFESMNKTNAGQPFIDFTIENGNIDGTPASLSDYVGKGKYVLVDFWASWCAPCIRTLPGLVSTYQKYKNKGFEIVGISLDNNQQNWANATAKHQITWPQLSNLEGWSDPAAQAYSINSIPATFLLDGNGTIIGKNLNEAELEQRLSELLK